MRRLPEGSHWLFPEHWGRAPLIGEVDDIQEGFDLGIVGHGDASAPAWRSIPTVTSIGAVAPVVSVGRSDPPRPPRPPLPPDPPGPPSALTVSEPPRGSTRYSFGWPTADTLTSRRAWLPDLRSDGLALAARLLPLRRPGHSSHLRRGRDYSDLWNPCSRLCRSVHRCR